jgi:hypothetical protein
VSGVSAGRAVRHVSLGGFDENELGPTLSYTRPAAVKRRALLIVLLAAAAIFAAWRVGAPSSGRAAAGESSGSVSFEEGSSTWATDLSQAAVAQMSVFTRPRTESDVLPSDYSFRLGSMSCGDWRGTHDACFGDDIAGQSRLLFTGLGETETSLYAWPMASRGVCWASGKGGGMCVNHFTAANGFMGVDPDTPGSGAPLTLIGIVPDDVVAARVKVNGIDHDALIENNGLFYELSDSADTCQAVDSVTISHGDGSSDTIHDNMIGWMWTSPESDAQPASGNADGVPTAPPPDPGPSAPRC